MLRSRDILVRIRIRTFDYRIRLRIRSCYFRLCWLLLKLHLHHFSKIKTQEVTKQQELRFFLFWLDYRRIRIRIQKAQKHTDADPDSQHFNAHLNVKDLGITQRSRVALRVVFIELEWGVWLNGGHHAGGEEAGGRLHVLEPFLLVQQRRQLDPRNKAARQQ